MRSPDPKWRTVLGIVALAGLMLGAAAVLRDHGDSAQKMFGDFVFGIAFLGGSLAAGHSIQHLAGGGGVKGAVAALMSDAKAEEAK